MSCLDFAIRLIRPFVPGFILEKRRKRQEERSIRNRFIQYYSQEVAPPEGVELVFKNNTVEVVKDGNKVIILSMRHLIYLYDIVPLFDYYFDVICPVKRYAEEKEQFVVDYSKPAKHRLNNSNLSFYFSSLAEGIDSALHYLARPVLKPGDVVLDCGAFCGISAYIFSQAVGPNGKVLALEPDRNNFRMLEKNIVLHKLSNVIPVRKGIWSENTRLFFNEEGSLGGCVTSLLHREFNKNIHKVKVISLKDICALYGIVKPDFVKMGIEGAEIAAIEGAKEFIRNNTINFAIASYHVVDGKMTYERLEQIFGEIGYEYYTHRTVSGRDHGSLITYAWKPDSRGA